MNAEQQRQEALSSAARGLAQLTSTGIAMGVKLSDAREVLLTHRLKDRGVQDISLEGDRQVLSLRIKFSRQFTELDAGGNDELLPILSTLKPEISGSIAIIGSVTSALATEGAAPELQFRVLPALAQVSVDKIKLADKVDVTAVGEKLAALLNRYKDNVTGELSRSSIAKVKIPALAPNPFDLSKAFQLSQAGGVAQIVVDAKPIKVPFKLDGVVWLVTEKTFTALAQLGPSDGNSTHVLSAASAQAVDPASAVPAKATPASAPRVSDAAIGTASANPTFDAVKARFQELVKVGFDVPDADSSTWVAVRKDLVSAAVNSAVAQAGVCVSAAASMPTQKVSKTIPMPKTDEISCAQDDPCNLAECKFTWEEDTRGCSGWGRITCEIGKALENQKRLAEANAKVAACQLQAPIDKGLCEAAKTTRRTACEAAKVGLKVLGPNIANVDADVALRTDGFRACLRDFMLGPALERVQFALEVQGAAVADVNVKFMPLDVVGHLTCFQPWEKRETFKASLMDSRVTASSAIRLSAARLPAQVSFVTKPILVKARLSPTPGEYVLNNRDMAVSCPIVLAARPFLVTLGPLSKEMRGEIDYTMPSQEATLNLPLPTLKLGNTEVEASVLATDQAIVIKGRMATTK